MVVATTRSTQMPPREAGEGAAMGKNSSRQRWVGTLAAGVGEGGGAPTPVALETREHESGESREEGEKNEERSGTLITDGSG
jgi:hypothetical protein